jgi:hypothetical protein
MLPFGEKALAGPRRDSASRVRRAVPGIAMVLAAALVSPCLADPVSVSDLELLVRGGVGDAVVLRHVERWGLERDLDTADLLALSQAGASEDLLETLVGGGLTAAEATRTRTLADGDGLLLTNLDESGRRLGGEDPEPAPFNQVEPTVTRYDPVERPAAVAAHTHPPRAVPVAPPAPTGISLGHRYPVSYGTPYTRFGTPGGYTRYKLFYSRAPYDGFRTWVPPVTLVVGAPTIVSTHPRTPYGPVFFSY